MSVLLWAGPGSLRHRAEGGGLGAGLAPEGPHGLHRGLAMHTEEGAAVQAQLAAGGAPGRLALGAAGDDGRGTAPPGRPGQQDVDQRPQQQTHQYGQTEGQHELVWGVGG